MSNEEKLRSLEEEGHAFCLEAVILRGPTEDSLREYLRAHEGKDTKHTRRADRLLHGILHPKPVKKKKNKKNRKRRN